MSAFNPIFNFGAFLFVIPFLFLTATAILKWLWNITIPDIFRVRRIT